MFELLGAFVVRRRRLVLVATGVIFLLAGVVGGGVAEHLTTGGFDDPHSEAALAADALEKEFGVSDPNLVLLVDTHGGNVDATEMRAVAEEITAELSQEANVEQVFSYWSTNVPALKSRQGDKAMILGVVTGNDDLVNDRVGEISEEFTGDRGPVTVGVGGFAEVFRQVGTTIEDDLVKAEKLALPITLFLLVLVFGSLVSASLPLAVGGLAIVCSFLALRAIAAITDVSIYSLSLVTMMGLGLAIDYSLFVVSRFREELRKGLSVEAATQRTVATAGRTIAFSGVTVAISLAVLLVFPLSFLRSFAYAGVAVVMLAAIGATTFLPALLAVLGPRVDKLSWRRKEPKPVGQGFWHRTAMFVMKRPLPIAAGVIGLLLFLGAPFLNVAWGLPDDRVLPKEASSRVVSDTIRNEFDVNTTTTLSVLASDIGSADESDIAAYAQRLSNLDGVAAVDSLAGTFALGQQVAPPGETSARFEGEDGTWLSVIPDLEAYSPRAERLVNEVRDAEAPFDVRIAGPTAALVDLKDSLFGRMPLAGGLIALATFVLLFLMFGGILVPLKAIVLNLLSLTATFGALVWIFQDGNLSGPLDFMATGLLDVTNPILMFCVAFGLSMDYEVFLLSRIKEEHDRTGDNTRSVAMGLERTGRIVTAAALLLSVVFAAFSTSDVTFIKMIGIGLMLAVIVDATLVRAALVPAFMRLAGEANWWAPRWMRKLYERFNLSETETPDEQPTPGPPVEVSG